MWKNQLSCSFITIPDCCRLSTWCTLVPFILIAGFLLSLNGYANVKSFDFVADNSRCKDSRI